MADAFDARDFIERYFARMWDLSQGGVEALRQWETEDVRWELPWTEGFAGFNGLDEHARVLGSMTNYLSHYEVRMTSFYATDDPERVIIEAVGGGPTVDGREYRNEHVMFMTFRDGKVAHVKEYANPLATRELRG